MICGIYFDGCGRYCWLENKLPLGDNKVSLTLSRPFERVAGRTERRVASADDLFLPAELGEGGVPVSVAQL